jgi:multidrug efflux pump subunit AcrB
MAQVQVQNCVSLALPKLPDVVKTTGVSTKKKSPSIMLVVNLFSHPDPATKQPIYDQLYLSNDTTMLPRERCRFSRIVSTVATINGALLPGVSSGQAIQMVEEVAKAELSSDLKVEWTELTYLQLLERSAAIFAFIGTILLVFQVLSAQYESYRLQDAKRRRRRHDGQSLNNSAPPFSTVVNKLDDRDDVRSVPVSECGHKLNGWF